MIRYVLALLAALTLGSSGALAQCLGSVPMNGGAMCGNLSAPVMNATGTGTALSVTNNATIGGVLSLTGAGNALLVNNSAVFGNGGTQTLTINGNRILAGGSSTGFVQIKLATTASQFAVNQRQ